MRRFDLLEFVWIRLALIGYDWRYKELSGYVGIGLALLCVSMNCLLLFGLARLRRALRNIARR